MLSFVWPDQLERFQRLDHAIAIARATPLPVTAGDAGEWLGDRLSRPLPDGVATVVFHSIVWQYLPAATKDRVRAALATAGERATGSATLHWLRMEPATKEHADLRLTSWRGDGAPAEELLAHVGYHGAGRLRHAAPQVRQAVTVTATVLERDDELVQLHSALADARQGRGGIALVAGEAGAGKTTLVRESLRGAAGRPRVLFGACDPISNPRTLGPLIDAATPHDPALARRLTAGLNRASAFAAVTELLDNGDTTVFVIEDAHWADEATLDLLTYV
eukprot:gene24918-45831_t